MSGSNISPLIRITDKLTQYAGVSDRGRAAISDIPHVEKVFEPGSYFVREGDFADSIGILSSGFAACQRSDGQGHRQIVSVKIPGDIIGLQSLLISPTAIFRRLRVAKS